MKSFLLIFILSLHLSASGVSVFSEKDRVNSNLFYDYFQLKIKDYVNIHTDSITHRESDLKYRNSAQTSRFRQILANTIKIESKFDYFSSTKYSTNFMFCNKADSVKRGAYFYKCINMQSNSINEDSLFLVTNSSEEKSSAYKKFKPLTSGFSLRLKDYEKLDVNYIVETVNLPYKEIANQLFKSATDMLAVKYTIVLQP